MSALVTARIRPSNGRGLWLFVDRVGDSKTAAADLNGFVSTREEDELGGVAYAILPEEVQAIKTACEDWLSTQEQAAKNIDQIAEAVLASNQEAHE